MKRQAGAPPSAPLERLVRQTVHRIIAVSGSASDGTETAERIASADSRDLALRAFIDYSDSLSAAKGVDRVVVGIAESPANGGPAWDAALVDCRLGHSKLCKPDWINAPAEFRQRKILLERSTFESVWSVPAIAFCARSCGGNCATLQSYSLPRHLVACLVVVSVS
jgi:hypothetical protein